MITFYDFGSGAPVADPLVHFFNGDTATRPWSGSAVYPSARYFADIDTTFFTWLAIAAGPQQIIRITGYEHATGTWLPVYRVATSPLTNDTHGAPAIVRDADGYLYVFHGSHDTSQQWAISNAANDISAWTAQTAISGIYTYPKPVLVGSALYLFMQSTSTGGEFAVRSATPTAGAATFSAATTLINFGIVRIYVSEFHVVGTEVHFCATSANGPDTEREGVYYFVYDTADGSLSNHDGSTSVASGSLPVGLTSANASFRLFDHGSNRGDLPSLAFDTSGDPHILYLDGTGTSFNLQHIKKSSGTWSSPVTVASGIKDFNGSSGYIDVVALVPMASGEMAAWYPADAGLASYALGGDMVRKIRSAGGTWGSAVVMAEATDYHFANPFAVANADADMRVAFTEITNSESDSALAPLKRYVHGDSGYIERPGADPLFANRLLQIQFTGANGSTSATDESYHARAVTMASGAQIQSNKLELDGTNDVVTIPDSPSWTPTGDFTYEVFGLEFRTAASNEPILAHYNANSNRRGWLLSYQSAALRFYVSTGGSGTSGSLSNILTYTWSPSTNTPYDIAVVRSGNDWYLFLDGVAVASTLSTAVTLHDSNDALAIGRANAASPGYADIRVKAVRMSDIALYTAGYTPPSLPLPGNG